MNRFFGHSDLANPKVGPDAPGAQWQPLAEHLEAVATLASDLAADTRPADPGFANAAKWAGLLHDLGKYQRAFQEMLLASVRGERTERVPHAVFGAALAAEAAAHDIALAVYGHHAGLPNLHSFGSTARKALETARTLWRVASLPEELAIQGSPPRSPNVDKLAFDLRVRMLGSCLIDADRRDTAHHAGRPRSTRQRLLAEDALNALLTHVEQLAKQAPEGPVKRARLRVLDACLEAAGRPERLQSLSAPTGAGKTLASMAFALRRAVERPDEVRRVIVVIPFLSIIEQNAQIYRRVFNELVDVLEHHSGNPMEQQPGGEEELPNARQRMLRETEEDWDAPIIVTTSVRFFESLFSNRPRDLRRIHNISRSVVIFDEVQTVPRPMLAALLDMMKRLADEWYTSFLFCTATQPAFERSKPHRPEGEARWDPGTVREVLEHGHELYRTLDRVRISWPKPDHDRPTWDQVVDAIKEQPRVLCIVNTKEQARELFTQLRDESSDSCWHLSTRMCAQHRLRILAEIKRQLSGKSKIWVISTQLVEAGVNIDFPVVYRQIAPLDAIVQAAGRCDREGLLTAERGSPGGRVFVVDPVDGKSPPGCYQEGIDIVRDMLRDGIDVCDPNRVRRYFDRLYGADPAKTDTRQIQSLRRNLEFKEVAARFQMIGEQTRAVFVPYDETARKLIKDLEGRLKADAPKREVLRRLQRYQVGLFPHELKQARNAGTVHALDEEGQWLITRSACYDEDVGLLIGETNADLIV